MKSFLKHILTFILKWESKMILKKYKPTIVAVTGSVGKTSTKDAIFSVLSSVKSMGVVRKSDKSFNSEIGVPLTILGCKNGWNDPTIWLKNIFHGLELIIFKSNYPNCLVLEVGADHPGDIQKIAKWLKPHIVVITRISDIPVHVEFFPSPEALFNEKASLARNLRPGGTLILSEDDQKIKVLAQELEKHTHLTFGIKSPSSVTATHDSVFYEEKNGVRMPSGMAFKLNYQGNSLPIMIRGVLGLHHVYPLLAAAAVGISQGILLTDIVAAISKHTPTPGRMNILEGLYGSILIDDSYNSSPDALHEALTALGRVDTTGKKIAVLGDMLELGKHSLEEHAKAGKYAEQVASTIVTVGQRARGMSPKVKPFATSPEAAEYVKKIITKGDVVLIKGSQSIRMEKIVKVLMKDPERARELLVRQDREWLARK